MGGKVPATEFKATCLKLMDRVAEKRESFVITKRGKPVARLCPVEAEADASIFGCLRDKAWISGDILGPVASLDTWEALGTRAEPRPPGRARKPPRATKRKPTRQRAS